MQNTFIAREFSFEEHQNLFQVIEEVVYCLKDWAQLNSEQQDCVSEQQALTLLRFGQTYDISDIQYWRCCKSVAEKVLLRQDADMETVLKISLNLLNIDMLTPALLRTVHALKERTGEMRPQKLAMFSTLLLSEEMREAVGDVTEAKEKLVESLHQSLIKFDLQNFAIVSTSIANSSLDFSDFLKVAEPIAVDLIHSNEPSARELTNILSCFVRHGQTSTELIKEVFKQMDEADLGPEHAVECYCLLTKFKASAKSSKFLENQIRKQVQLLRPNETYDVFMASKVLKATPTFTHSLF